MDSLVDAHWLSAHLDDPDLVVLDCSVEVSGASGAMKMTSGRASYDAAHIPGAAFADLVVDLSDTSQSIGFAVPTVEAFCAAMERLGVGDDTDVVLYDTSGSMWAARVWWMLRWVGFDRAAILDGGLPAWTAAGHLTADEAVTCESRSLTPRPRTDLIADRDEVLRSIDDEQVRLLDTLPEQHFRGEFAMYERPGHIRNAINVPMFAALDDSGRIAANDRVIETHGGELEQRAITYCGGGIAASLNAFAMTRAGYTSVAVYAASLQEWAADPTLPMVAD